MENNWVRYGIIGTVIIVLLLTLVSHNTESSQSIVSDFRKEHFEIPFILSNPSKTYPLPKALNEISGLAYYDDNIYAVNDEKGNLYVFDLKSGEISDKMQFGKNDDYEGLTMNDQDIFVAKSNGNIIKINLASQSKLNTIKTPLSKRNDIEGICYDKTQNQLLLVCKGQLLDKKQQGKGKGIYSYNLTTEQFNEDPYLRIDLVNEVNHLKSTNKTNNSINRQEQKRLKMFAPSGIAMDPVTNYLYVISNRGRTLTVIDESITIISVSLLDNDLYKQPEGIVFDPKGNLYISNEAKGGKANIIRLDRLSQKKEGN